MMRETLADVEEPSKRPMDLALAEADAQQHVVRVVVFGAEEMRVVRGDDREIQLVGEREDALVEDRLALRLVRLHLEVVAILEQVRVP